jgi:HK97 family phage major capsid protein
MTEIKNLRDIRARQAEIRKTVDGIQDTIAKEQRAMNADEEKQFNQMAAEASDLKLRAYQIEHPVKEDATIVKETREQKVNKIFKDFISNRSLPDELKSNENPQWMNIPAYRAYEDATAVANITPLTIGDIVQPLEKGLILAQTGAKVQTGMTGAWLFPVVAGVEASWNGENDQISDTTISIDKVIPTPKRLAIAVPVSNRALNQSANSIRNIVLQQIQLAVTRALNKAMFSTAQIASAPTGCFVSPTTKLTTAASAVYSYSDLLGLKAGVEKTGVIKDGTAAFIMSTSTYYKLKATKSTEEHYILENDRIDGTPVFVTEYIGDGVVGYGIFNYELCGFFGNAALSIDSSSAAVATKNLTYFVLNADVDFTSLRPEAFGTLTLKA